MGGPYYASLGGGRIADAPFDGAGDFQDLSGSDDANVINFADSTFIVVCNINSVGKDTQQSDPGDFFIASRFRSS